MSLFTRKSKRKEHVPVNVTQNSDAQRAKERALSDQRAAVQDLEEAKRRATWSKNERMINHFGPLLYEAMRKK